MCCWGRAGGKGELGEWGASWAPECSRLELLCYSCWPWGRHVFSTSLSFPLCKYGKLHVHCKCKIFQFYDIRLRINWLVSGNRGWWLRILEPECFWANPAHSFLPVWPWASHWTLLVRDTSTPGTLTGRQPMSELLLYSWTCLDRLCEAFGTKQVLCLLCDSKKQTNRFRNWKEKILSFFVFPQIELGGREHTEGFRVKVLGCWIPLSSFLTLP